MVAEVGDTHERGVGLALASRAVDHLAGEPGAARVGLEDLLPHRAEVGEHPALAGVLLGDLELHRLVGVLHAPEHRVQRLTRLEVERAVLGLQEHVVGEAALGAVGLDLVVDRPELEQRAA